MHARTPALLALSLTHTHTHKEKYIILIAFPRQFLRHRASTLRHTYTDCLVLVLRTFTTLQVFNLVNLTFFVKLFLNLEVCITA